MILDSQSEAILKYIIDLDKLQPSTWFESETICAAFSTINPDIFIDIIKNLYTNSYIDALLSDTGISDIQLLHKGRVYFETKAMELAKQQPQNVTINNSSNFNVGNGNNINVTTGITADYAIKLIEQSTMNDKEAMKEIITLLNDAIVNNKPLKASKFSKVLSHISSLAPLIQMIGGIVVSAMQGHDYRLYNAF